MTLDSPAATAGQWRRLALAALRKSGATASRPPSLGDASSGDASLGDASLADVDELLATVTYDGIRIAGLHTPDDPPPPSTGLPGRFPYVRGSRATGGWDVRQHHPHFVRDAVLEDLENGATSVWLAIGEGGMPIEALPDALDGVVLDLAGVTLDAGDAFPAAARAWFALPGAEQSAANLGADPLGRQARTGDRGDLNAAVALATRCTADAPDTRAITVDATIYHDAGGSDAQELGCAAAAGVAYLRALTEAGLPVAAALTQLDFRYAATADQFATIAKLRAARRIWARIAGTCGAPAAGGQRQHAVTSAAMMTARDPWTNLLRGTIAAFAAGIGGADAVTVLPYDHALGDPSASARRLARNTQLLLLEEAHVGRVVDPAGGSWYVERYTEDLAQAAWKWFTTIERSGGFAAALGSGLIADGLAATWEKRADDIAHRRYPITGVSEFPDLHERPTAHRRPGSRGRRNTFPVAGAHPARQASRAGGLPRHRYADAFERLRDRADAHPHRPTVYLGTLGSAAGYGARVAFATNLFAAGGIGVVVGPLGEFTGPGVVCVCGADDAYTENAGTLPVPGAKRIWLAGKGDCPEADGFLDAGCDAVAVLTTTLADLGVAE